MTAQQISDRVLARLDDDGTFYTAAEVLAAINEAQRVKCFGSLENAILRGVYA